MRYVTAVGHIAAVFVCVVAIGQWLTSGSVDAHENLCSTWADMIGKEGVVRDSAIMHGAGCDDGPNRSRHYDEAGFACASIARIIVHENPQYWLKRPRMLAAEVRHEMPACVQFEDGTYAQ